MDTSYCCPDCGDEHRNPAEATLGREVRCLDCQIEIDLALEFKALPIPQIAAQRRPDATAFQCAMRERACLCCRLRRSQTVIASSSSNTRRQPERSRRLTPRLQGDDNG